MIKILAINPGSTSTKIGVFNDKEKIWDINIHHDEDELNNIIGFDEQIKFRKREILKHLKTQNFKIENFDVFASRGGVSIPIPGGTYLVNEKTCENQKNSKLQHPCNLASPIAKSFADDNNKKAYFTDSPFTCELMPLAFYSGHKEIPRSGRFHALNQKAIARHHSEKMNKAYEESNYIVAHLGGGISVGAHEKGLVIDVNDALDEGPFTPQRTGGLPVRSIIDMCFTSGKTHEEMKKFIQGNGGLFSYLGTNDCIKALEMGKEDKKVQETIDALIYQISMEIGKRSVSLKGDIDAILITGGIANSDVIIQKIIEYVKFLAPIYVYPGELELESLALGAYKAFKNEIEVKEIK